MSYREVYEKWCNDPYFDEASREELKALEGNEAEIEDRFYRQLEFGTAVFPSGEILYWKNPVQLSLFPFADPESEWPRSVLSYMDAADFQTARPIRTFPPPVPDT